MVAKRPGDQNDVLGVHAQLVYKGFSGVPSIELFRALFDVSENLSGTGLNG